FADKAEEEGFSNIARLFRAISYAERVHAGNHYRVLGNIGITSENLQVAIDGETYEVEEMYPVFNQVAKFQEERGAESSTNWALRAEKIHASLYQKAKQAALEGKDIRIGKIQICSLCGYTVEGEAPERCPICNATKDKFKEF
ncbi:MAG: rubrerythrin family protein, partial [Candidatus Bathyarchaeia archaeon]